jgi:hypothetical protein
MRALSRAWVVIEFIAPSALDRCGCSPGPDSQGPAELCTSSSAKGGSGVRVRELFS